MNALPGPCRFLRCFALLVLAACVSSKDIIAQQALSEEASFEAARAKTEPEARRASLQGFLEQFPAGARSSAARDLLLQTYLVSFAQETAAIHTLAAAMVASTPVGFERWVEESRLAGLLAAAGSGGADLPDARLWADEALRLLTEESYRRAMFAAQARYKLPRVPPRQMRAEYLGYRVSFLSAVAAVDLCERHLDHASAMLAETYRLQPLSGEVNLLRGRLAVAQGDKPNGLQALERADALGSLPEPWRDREVQLFAKLNHGDQQTLETRVDDVYRGLFPPAFTLPPRQLPSGGHTVLLELFTGSGCGPCAAPDLAVESLLHSYSRHDLVILAFDEHIPRPDPLTTPDAITRAAVYGVANTPAAFLDGQPADLLGGSRADTENNVVALAEQVEDEAQLPSGLHLQLTAERRADGSITALPTLGVVPVPPAVAAETTGDVSARKLAQAKLYVALVRADIRYSGENGVRFHRMVVQAVSELPAAASLAISSSRDLLVFRPADLDRAQEAYLSDFERHNDRFGTVHFASKHFPMAGEALAVVAWVQDPVTRRVWQAAYAPVPAR